MKANTPAPPPLVFYLCDMEKCENCSGQTKGLCKHTTDKKHAKYKKDSLRKFERRGLFLIEKEGAENGAV